MSQYLAIKQKILTKEYDFLNPQQRQAVFQVNGPLLILAGAGSGKTTVLINRIGYLLTYGDAWASEPALPLTVEEENFLEQCVQTPGLDRLRMVSLLKAPTVQPWNVLAITFTNKAANELKARLASKLGEDVGGQVRAGTFHWVCVRILRREIQNLGYTSSFTIYDTDDSLRVIKDCIASLGVNDKMFPPKTCLNVISRWKDSMVYPDQAALEAGSDFRQKILANLYTLYQQRLKTANAVDFDDIILLTVELFTNFPDVLDHYQNLFKYILVDEYQDTNQMQFELVRLLSQKYGNLCVVGDDDQSIYKFRGATIENILSFEKNFQGAKVVRLEQNYRSTQHILDAANGLIQNNRGRKGKRLWSDQGEGEKVKLFRCRDDYEETAVVLDQIHQNCAQKIPLKEQAILYRMNAQSGQIEKRLVQAGIAYQIVGGTKFFDRKEIRDVLAYFHVMDNPADEVRLRRIINEPKRGIGNTTVAAIEQLARQTGATMMEVIRNADQYALLSKRAGALLGFARLMDELTDLAARLPLEELLDELMERTGYRTALEGEGVEGQVRLENIEELKSNLVNYQEEQGEEGDLSGFLEEVSLYTDLDRMNQEEDKITLMTVHAAKGLEFGAVYLIGMEESIFPSSSAMLSEEELEEERRLAYVAITRAKRKLCITCAGQRMLFGMTQHNLPSRFLAELPPEDLERVELHPRTEYGMGTSRPAPVRRPAGGTVQGTTALAGVSPKGEKSSESYGIGDRVRHRMFGSGTVLNATAMGGDTLLEIAFDKVGTKKIMAAFAKLKKE